MTQETSKRETFHTHRPGLKFVTIPTVGKPVAQGAKVAFAGLPPDAHGSTSGGMSGGASGAISLYDAHDLPLCARTAH